MRCVQYPSKTSYTDLRDGSFPGIRSVIWTQCPLLHGRVSWRWYVVLERSFPTYNTTHLLDDVMLSVFAIGFKIRGFKPGRGDRYLRAIKIRNTPSFGAEEKPSAYVLRLYVF
jgi:hypothetical protein